MVCLKLKFIDKQASYTQFSKWPPNVKTTFNDVIQMKSTKNFWLNVWLKSKNKSPGSQQKSNNGTRLKIGKNARAIHQRRHSTTRCHCVDCKNFTQKKKKQFVWSFIAISQSYKQSPSIKLNSIKIKSFRNDANFANYANELNKWRHVPWPPWRLCLVRWKQNRTRKIVKKELPARRVDPHNSRSINRTGGTATRRAVDRNSSEYISFLCVCFSASPPRKMNF